MSLARRVIPCLDVDQGRVVKGVRFMELRDAGDPVACAAAYDLQGADEILLLDITASSSGRATMVQVVEQVSEQIFIPLTVGGGIRGPADAHRLLNAGADKISINSAAVQEPSLVQDLSRRFGAQCVVAAIDARWQDDRTAWEVYTHGGRRPTGLDCLEWAIRLESLGAGEILLTSMDRDGTGEGFDLALTRAVSRALSIPVIASGGVGKLEHLVQGVLQGEADAVLAAGIFHFGQYSIAEAKQEMARHGIPVRPVPPEEHAIGSA